MPSPDHAGDPPPPLEICQRLTVSLSESPAPTVSGRDPMTTEDAAMAVSNGQEIPIQQGIRFRTGPSSGGSAAVRHGGVGYVTITRCYAAIHIQTYTGRAGQPQDTRIERCASNGLSGLVQESTRIKAGTVALESASERRTGRAFPARSRDPASSGTASAMNSMRGNDRIRSFEEGYRTMRSKRKAVLRKWCSKQ